MNHLKSNRGVVHRTQRRTHVSPRNYTPRSRVVNMSHAPLIASPSDIFE